MTLCGHRSRDVLSASHIIFVSSMYVRLFLGGAVKVVNTAPWPLYPNKNVWQIELRCLHLPGGFRGWPIQWNHVGPTLVAMAAKFGLGAEI